ncbi:sugar ABC transporter ATP-binding protein [Calycomorphotria hydatis]|uniref:Ribose import ATP-binding protein RbsA n=1 Tax=Calycomorphotria hydatis TaxID=2528027 RepID=A0A517T616_9PLAN|nr:sugar ABC transporter ATP-binding protein [Calycomorphotria hydatis]QDT63826.1 Ribose import ATP-binding protein RbsA [Calycomorphotria hydatis]
MNVASAELLQVHSVTKRYGETTVLNNCRFDVRSGEIHALLGGNGAGKSTLVRIISGLVTPTDSDMLLSGKAYSPNSKRDAEIAGIDIVQQELNLIPTLNVAENLLLSRLPAVGGVIRQTTLHRHAKAALERLGLKDIATDTIVGTLGVGQQQMVEIAAALDRECRLLILDEPTAALSIGETESLFQWLIKLREQGVGIIYISHRLDEVARLADRITVLRDGHYIATHDAKGMSTNEMVDLMTGEIADATSSKEKESNSSGSLQETHDTHSDVAMWVENITGGIVDNVSFQVHQGERLGIAGLVGSGRTELLRLIFGADTANSGEVYLHGASKPSCFQHPSEAVSAGIAMLTEDRKKNGLLLTQSIRVNSTLAAMWKRFSSAGVIQSRTERKSAQDNCLSMETRCEDIDQHVGTLSGGNQQKVVIAKWLTVDANVFLFDEPTRGIDVPARRRIYRLIDQLANDGKAIVIVSSDLEELFETCDRIAVMSNGKLVNTFVGPEFSHDEITQAAFSGYLDRQSAG